MIVELKDGYDSKCSCIGIEYVRSVSLVFVTRKDLVSYLNVVGKDVFGSSLHIIEVYDCFGDSSYLHRFKIVDSEYGL